MAANCNFISQELRKLKEVGGSISHKRNVKLGYSELLDGYVSTFVNWSALGGAITSEHECVADDPWKNNASFF